MKYEITKFWKIYFSFRIITLFMLTVFLYIVYFEIYKMIILAEVS